MGPYSCDNAPISQPTGPSTIHTGHTHSQLKTASTDNASSSSQPSLQTIPLPSPSHAEPGNRDSTMTQYIELSSSLLGGEGSNGNVIRYSMADSGVNMTSPNMEPGSELPRNGDVENVRFRRYPYFVTQIPPSGSGVVTRDGDSESSYYNTMIPFSVLGTGDKEGVERSGDTGGLTDVDTESGVGMESQVFHYGLSPPFLVELQFIVTTQ